MFTPEAITDSPDTAPCKRILAMMPSYQKPIMGTLAAMECPHFAEWDCALEEVAT
jgi:hypothetical protein